MSKIYDGGTAHPRRFYTKHEPDTYNHRIGEISIGGAEHLPLDWMHLTLAEWDSPDIRCIDRPSTAALEDIRRRIEWVLSLDRAKYEELSGDKIQVKPMDPPHPPKLYRIDGYAGDLTLDQVISITNTPIIDPISNLKIGGSPWQNRDHIVRRVQ